MNSLQKNNTFDLVELPNGIKTLKNKWVFKLKQGYGNRVKYRTRLVVKNFGQMKGIDFDENFLLVQNMSSIGVVLVLPTSLNMEIEQLNVKIAFLHGDLI